MIRTRNVENDKTLGIYKSTHTPKAETQEEAIQKEVQNYTRKFEEEKRKLFRAQENQREIMKEYKSSLSQLESMKTKKYKTEMATLSAKIKCMEGNFDKSIGSYNDTLSKNNSLKNEIDQLRKDKKNQMEAYKKLIQKIEELQKDIKNKEQDINDKKQKVFMNRGEIIAIRDQNEKENLQFKGNITELQKTLKVPDVAKQTLKTTNKSAETSDSQPLVKMRLRNLLLKNKEKVRICETYKKNMEKIQENFQEIKQRSGIQSLEEIKNTFLKHDQQNIFIEEYISKLNCQLDVSTEENQILRKKIEQQQEKNASYRSALSGTPQQKKRKMKLEAYISEKKRPISKMNQFLSQVSEQVLQTLVKDRNEEVELNFFNYEQNLYDLEKMINEVYKIEKIGQDQIEVKEDITKYSRVLPLVNSEEMKEKNEEGLLQEGRLRDYASDFWEKKRAGKN